MYLTKESPEVRKIIDEIEEVRGDRSEKQLDLSVSLYELAQSHGDKALKDYANCALGEACCQNHDFMQAIYYLSSGIDGVIEAGEDLLACRCLNEIGIIMRHESNYISSGEAFMRCIRLAHANRFYQYEAIASSNMAALCEQLGDFEDALNYRYDAIRVFDNCGDFPNKDSYIIGVMSYLVMIYCIQGDRKKADNCYKQLMDLVRSSKNEDRSFELTIANVYYHHLTEDRQKENEACEEAIGYFFDCEDYMIYFDETFSLFQYMFKEKKYDRMLEMFKHFESVSVEEEMLNHHMLIEQMKMDIYEEIGMHEEACQAAFRYSQLNKKKNLELKDSVAMVIKIQSENMRHR